MFLPSSLPRPVRHSCTATWESIDRAHFRVAVIEGTICRSIAPNVMPNDTVVPGEDTDAMLLLETGRADAAIGHVTVMERCAKTRGGAVFIPEPRVGLVKAFAFRKGNPDVKRIPDNSNFLTKMNGSMRVIFSRTDMKEIVVD